MNFAEKLKAARTAAGLSQHGMADRMLIPFRTIQKWEITAATPPPYVQRFVLNELAEIAKNEELKKFEEKLNEARMEEVHKHHYISAEKREELQARIDAGEKPADIFNPKRTK